MPLGSFFAKLKEFNATTADNKIIKVKNNFITRIGFVLLGLPHMGMRLRSRKIIRNSPKRIVNMLDAGCGTGVYSFYFSNFAKDIQAIDISKDKIDYLKRENFLKNINFSRQDLCNLPFEKESFDFIVCSDVLEHIKEDEKAISELSRVLKKNGTILITVPYYSKNNEKTYKIYDHERAGYNLKILQSKIKDTSLGIVKNNGYSYSPSNKISNFSYKFTNNKFVLGILFYPLYILAIILDTLKIGEPNGLFVELRKC